MLSLPSIASTSICLFPGASTRIKFLPRSCRSKPASWNIFSAEEPTRPSTMCPVTPMNSIEMRLIDALVSANISLTCLSVSFIRLSNSSRLSFSPLSNSSLLSFNPLLNSSLLSFSPLSNSSLLAFNSLLNFSSLSFIRFSNSSPLAFNSLLNFSSLSFICAEFSFTSLQVSLSSFSRSSCLIFEASVSCAIRSSRSSMLFMRRSCSLREISKLSSRSLILRVCSVASIRILLIVNSFLSILLVFSNTICRNCGTSNSNCDTSSFMVCKF